MSRPRIARRLALAAAVTIVGLACSSAVAPAGGLEVIVSSNIAIPSDFDVLRVEVDQEASTGTWTHLLANDYRIPSEATLPTTLAVASGKAADQTARVRVIARKGPAPLVLREVLIRLPSDRVAELRLVLATSCVGKLRVDASGDVTSSCANPDESCQPETGDCGPSTVDPSTLPDYAPGDELDATVPGADVLSSADGGAESSRAEDADATTPPGLDAGPPGLDAGKDAPAESGSDAAAQPPSCANLAPACGPVGVADCCASSVVDGGTFSRSYDAVNSGYTDPQYAATLSSYRLDTYETTVSRFRRFLADYPGNLPVAGAGKNPNNPADPGWDVAWNTAHFGSGLDQLVYALKCDAAAQTWTDVPAGTESKPINCVSWYEAFAFCIWDGGRLPTEAEWDYAAQAGGEQRVYPWSNPPSSTALSTNYAVMVPSTTPAVVGSKAPLGNGAFGHADLAGNVWEWVLDAYVAYPKPCSDCASFTGATSRVTRGGGYRGTSASLFSAFRYGSDPTSRGPINGFRCARSL